ncbi:hypothetical protein CAEBREN_17143 [Caenorhabditis brenneri]|uniref:Uncharacterized protein n=1 Tax=Caenorhabditis brenneri TaxID=135651 RepID=G0ME21_CAEBE|nr:hypothetical protein CAEBREN_17143 [Caenorhabditis brenneri]
MSPPEYCPLGSPSLLNGNFYENLARLTDFSWSVLFSSPPPFNVTEPGGFRPANTYTKGELFQAALKGFENDPFVAPIVCAVFMLYLCLVAFIGKKVASRITFNRKNSVRFHFICCFLCALTFISLFLSRTFPTIFPICLSTLFFIHVVCFGFGPAEKNVDVLKISVEDWKKYKNRNLKGFFIILAVIFFFFAPVYQTSYCQFLGFRLVSEISFYLSFELLYILYSEVNGACFLMSAKTLYVYKDGKSVKRCVKKEGFGWIEIDLDYEKA